MKTLARIAVAFGLTASATLFGCKDAAEQRPTVSKPSHVRPIHEAADPDVDVARPAPLPDAAPVRPHALPPMGYTPQPQRSELYIRSLARPTLQQAAPHFFQARGPPTPQVTSASDGKPILLYRALNEAHQRKFGKPFVVGRQEIGDCTSWGWSHAVDIVLAIDYLEGRSGDFQIVATEPMYGLGRVEGAGLTYNRSGDGSYGAAMAAGVTKFGVLFRLDYTGGASSECDLRVYSGARARNWGAFGCGGRADGGRLDFIARQHPIRQVALVTTEAETIAALSNGYPIPVCSGQGFTEWTDVNGIARPSGSWPHCMCAIGVRFDIPAVLILNSWGPDWLDQSRGIYPSDQPRGAFWCPMATWLRMIAGRDSYAVSSLIGFPRQELLIVKGL
ncbi:MAG: hypothetical protein K8U03_09325 [Planctomycetia bacterium]|nr:hypothetical protein [Planctomycetia bacterium]